MFEIVTDVSADFTEDIIKELDIKFVPMEVVAGNERIVCSRPCSLGEMHEFYENLRKRIPIKTSQGTPFHFAEVFRTLIEAGKEILCVTLSAALSKTYENALIAADQLREEFGDNAHIEVINGLGGTGGQGMLCHIAGIFRSLGMGLSECAEKIRTIASRQCYWFEVEDLMYLAHGGRISGASALLGTALNIKPILTVLPDGSLKDISRKRGTKMAFRYIMERYARARVRDNDEGLYPEGMENLVYISNSDCIDDALTMKNMVLEENPKAIVYITSVCHLIGAHVGPDFVTLVHFGKPGERKV